MNTQGKVTVMVTLSLVAVITLAMAGGSGGFVSCVDKDGKISVPKDYRTNWAHLGSWAVPAQMDPGAGFHDVYTQRDNVAYYKKNGKFPDGAVLVKEIRKAVWDEMSTGHVVYAGEPDTVFVMVKDTKGRFSGNPNWGEGWGWGLFKAADLSRNTSADYKEDCIPCHEPARDTDWVYINGYPEIR